MDDALVTLAERQHGTFSLRQARELGLTPAAVQHRLRTGRWDLLRPGVYRIPGARRTWEQRVVAAVLAAGPGAVASHHTAAAILGIPGFPRRGPVELTVLRPKRYRDASTTVHQTTHLPAAHVTVVDAIPLTRVARALVDLAGAAGAPRMERALDNCLSSGLVRLGDVAAVAAELARPGRGGTSLMRRLLEERGEGYVAPASVLEARFRRLLRDAGLPEPVHQFDAGDGTGWDGRSDSAYPDIRVLIELDSRRHHLSKSDFEADRARDNRRVAAGWRPLRFTWHHVTRAPAGVIEILLRSGVTPLRPGDVKRRKLAG